MENGFQVAFMAPTEILAEQHFATPSRWLAATRHRVALLSGRTPQPSGGPRCRRLSAVIRIWWDPRAGKQMSSSAPSRLW